MSVWSRVYRVAGAIVVIALMVVAAIVFVPPLQQYRVLRQRERALEEEVRRREQRLNELKRQQYRLQTDPAFVEKIAREEFGLARPGEVIFKFTEEAEEP